MNNLSGINAYLNQLKIAEDAKSGAPLAEEAAGNGFSDLLRSAVSEAKSSLQSAETLQLQALTGAKVDMTELVTALTSAELTLNTVVSIRDRAINAYNDILKMPI